MGNAATPTSRSRPIRRHAHAEITAATAAHGWDLIERNNNDNVWARGEQRLTVAFSPSGRAVDAGLYFPLGYGTGYIDDPTPVLTGSSGPDKLDDILGWIASPNHWDPLPSTLVLIPCGAGKRTTGARACELYTSDHFRLALRAARARVRSGDTRAMIFSAKHGLVQFERVLAPYDVTFGQSDAIDADFVARQLLVQHVSVVEALLPRRYLAVLREAVGIAARRGCHIEIVDRYADAPGIGYQRAVLSAVIADLAFVCGSSARSDHQRRAFEVCDDVG
ncbi:MAG: hypothetical protein PHQ28_00695 [Mycobacterium sp.]|nr:hypothetical protein [Mycobacterium sp.]